ncbi:macrophage colony-stimulating factor 1 receptor 2-like isoform X1 [Sebastes umbrosus]|uniref:macrophage colony-stimulating factor 1 receptor 2-like isoform X1 n=1 Tax=Sebastes umbrosus TaxID=72105 RepID=UPI00189DB952|nr:macrophage colony-stimulating factor 1 receptor 2-like isoform X1 [Sebastes umbrosus]
MKVRSLLLSIVFSCCCSAGDPPDPPDPPLIRLNSDFLPNRTEVVLEAGSGFNLSCHGDLSVRWSTTAFNLLYKGQQLDPLVVKKSDPRHTGTYRCGYTNRSLEHLDTWIHLYVTDPAVPSSVFVTSYRRSYDLKEGQDFLFKCLLTDPSVTNLTLQSEDSTGSLPQGMTVTFDPRRGALIRDLQPSFNGRYVCSGWKDGRQFRSKAVSLLVDRRPSGPPRLAVSEDEVVRLEGETFEVTCLTSNPSHLYMVTWTHPHLKTLNVTNHYQYSSSRLHIDSTLTVSNVSRTHGGTYTCTAINEDGGVATATTHLTVLDGPYLRIYLQLANANTKPIEVFEDPAANVSSVGMEVQGELEANLSSGSLKVYGELIVNVSTVRKDGDGDGGADVSGSSTVEVYEGRDVRLTFVMEAYPPIRNQHWTTTAQVHNDNNVMVYQESYAANGYRSEAILQLRRVRQEDRGRYSFHFDNSFFNGSQNIDLRVYRSPSVVVRLENDTLTCSSSGYPLPTILWNSCPGVRETCFNDLDVAHLPPAAVTSQEEEVRSHLTLPVSSGDDVTVECISYSQMGVSQEVFHPRNQQSVLTPALIGSLSVAAVLLLLLLVVFYQWRQKPRYEIRWKIIESTDGNNYTFVDPTQLPYNHEWEFPRDKLRLGAVVGSGAFGKVVEATAYGLGTNNVTRVAVKMLKPSAHSEEREALMSELKILGHLGYHDNIVNLLGACTRGGPMLMITEYCSHGDLLNFLRARAQDFMACVVSVDEVEGEAFYKNTAAQNARLRSDSGISCSSDYQEMQPVLSPGQTHQGVQTNRVSVTDLMRFSYQVAQGLDFLSTRNCIHRDVAARNVLLTDRRVAKICDFGLARDIRNDDSYIVQGNARLPVKWMAPESIFQCVYTVQSDVWSYGVLLWETFSLGKSPYPNVAVDTNFYKMIQDGRHMDQPDFAPAEMYELMTLCWSLEPTDRPTFKMIGQLIDRLLPSTNDTWPNHSDQSMYKNIDECREEEEEEEEVRGGEGALKRGEEEECSQRERHDDDHDDADDEEEEKPMMKNIYQLS